MANIPNQRITLLVFRAALQHCAHQKQSPFDRLRMKGTEWIPERKRFAFGRDI